MDELLLNALKKSNIIIQAIYPAEATGDKWHLAAVEMFGSTYRVYFSESENGITIEHIEEWRIG